MGEWCERRPLSLLLRILRRNACRLVHVHVEPIEKQRDNRPSVHKFRMQRGILLAQLARFRVHFAVVWKNVHLRLELQRIFEQVRTVRCAT